MNYRFYPSYFENPSILWQPLPILTIFLFTFDTPYVTENNVVRKKIDICQNQKVGYPEDGFNVKILHLGSFVKSLLCQGWLFCSPTTQVVGLLLILTTEEEEEGAHHISSSHDSRMMMIIMTPSVLAWAQDSWEAKHLMGCENSLVFSSPTTLKY